MIMVIGSFCVPLENLDAIRPMMEKVVAATRAEDGCILYAYSYDLIEPGMIRVTEKWRDRAALDAHFQTEHMAVWAQERAGFGLFGRDIKVFETDEGVAV